MAMTKKDKAALAAAMADAEKARDEAEIARDEAEIARALGWSRLPAPERSVKAPRGVPGDSERYRNGWDFNFYQSKGDARPAWTESCQHGSGHRKDNGWDHRGSASQNGRALYATRLDALIALRLAAERHFAERLAKIDAMIAAERRGTSTED